MANPNTIDWLHYQDIQIQDVNTRNSFNAFMSKGQYAEAIALLEKSSNPLKGKAFIAETINKITTGLTYLEKEFDTNVNLFLTELSATYYKLIDNLAYKQSWQAEVEYIPYNFVVYQNEVYMCFAKCPIGTLPTDENYWLKIGLRGEEGAPGIDAQMKYSWQENTSYEVNDIVSYHGDLYVAIKPNQNSIPSTSTEEWLPFIITIRNGILVSDTEPDKPQSNTVWFKTKTDPLVPTEGYIGGELYRYSLDIGWEIMYPLTIFSMLADGKDFQPVATAINLHLVPELWKQEQERFSYTIGSDKVVETSYVKVMQGEQFIAEQYNLYNSLGIECEIGKVILTCNVQPKLPLDLVIIIQ